MLLQVAQLGVERLRQACCRISRKIWMPMGRFLRAVMAIGLLLLKGRSLTVYRFPRHAA
jgi:hypothetical protein